jgi:hypothetical protein
VRRSGPLALSTAIGDSIGQTGLDILTRLFCLLLAAIAVKIIAAGASSLFPSLGSRTLLPLSIAWAGPNWVTGGCHRQIDGAAGLPSAPENAVCARAIYAWCHNRTSAASEGVIDNSVFFGYVASSSSSAFVALRLAVSKPSVKRSKTGASS